MYACEDTLGLLHWRVARALCALLRVCVSGLAGLKLFGLEASPWLCGVGGIPALTRTPLRDGAAAHRGGPRQKESVEAGLFGKEVG